MPLPLALAVAYGGYTALRLGSEWRYLNDYKKRYPWVKIRYPARTPAFKAIGSGLHSAGGLYYSGYGYSHDLRRYY